MEFDGLQCDFNLPEVPTELTKKLKKVCKNCPYTFVRNKNGSRKLVWKSSLVWMFNKGAKTISSDRLNRVKLSKKQDKHELRRVDEIENIENRSKLFLGDWCIFRRRNKTTSSRHLINNEYLVGLVLHFAKNFVDSNNKVTWKSIEYGENSVDTSNEKKNFGVLCQWYQINFAKKFLEKLPVNTHGYIELTYYEAHLPTPNFEVSKNKDGLIKKRYMDILFLMDILFFIQKPFFKLNY